MNAVTGQRAVLERVRLIGGVLQVFFGEFVGVDDQCPAFFEVGQVHFQGRRVHRHQHVGLVARRPDIVTGEIQLKTADPRQAAGGRANFSRKIRQRGDVIPDDGRRIGELGSG